MTLTLRPYPDYKYSGIEWLGNIPAHWKVLPGLAGFYEKQTKNTGMVENTVLSLSYGKLVVKPAEKLHGLVPESFETYQIVNPDDLIIRGTDLQNDWNSLRVGIARDRGIITSAYICLRTKEGMSPDYGYLLLHTYDLKKIFYGLGKGLRQNLSFADFKRLPIFIPPLPEQTAIARYLDHQNHLINRYIRARRKMITLLEAQKQAIIQQAVTRGLNLGVPMKDSGVEWLGEVPDGWSIKLLRRYPVLVQTGPFGSQLHAHDYVSNGFPVVNPANMVSGKIVPDPNKHVSFSTRQLLSRHILELGDIVFARRGELGRAVFVTGNEEGWLCGTGSILIRFRKKILNSEYLALYLQSKTIKEYFTAFSVGATMDNLNSEIILGLPILEPPLEEQARIVKYLEAEFFTLHEVLEKVEKEIALIREYRTRLIADVVTGKLDVREAAARLPEWAEEESEETDWEEEEQEGEEGNEESSEDER